MVSTSLDKIVRTALLKKGYSLHYYVQFLIFARECLKELTQDDLKVFNTKILAVNSYNAVDLPNDFQDYVVVGVMTNQGIRPLVEDKKLNVLNNFDADYNIIGWDGQDTSGGSSLIYYGGFPFSTWFTVKFNSYGEALGRSFGTRGGYVDTFVVSKERNQIQLNERLSGLEYIYLQYMSDGSDSGSATTIDPYAEMTLQAYCNWMHKENNRTYSANDRMIAKAEYIQQRQILRARKSDLTLSVLKRIIQKSSIGAPKN
jgi:hypothetical protein